MNFKDFSFLENQNFFVFMYIIIFPCTGSMYERVADPATTFNLCKHFWI